MEKLRKFFVKHFVPHYTNSHRPHLLRTRGAIALVAALFLVEGFFAAYVFVLVPASNFLSSIFAGALVDLANADRVEASVPKLTISPLLSRAAQLKAFDMAAKGYFAHVAPDGTTAWHWLDQVGYEFEYAGENLAINFTDSVDVQNAWMHSKDHRANILSSDFAEIGIGTADGMYEGKKTTFVVQLFGTRPPAKLAVVSEAPRPKAGAPKKIALEPANGNTSLVASAPSAAILFDTRIVESPRVLASAPRHVAGYAFAFLGALVALVVALMLLKGRRAWHLPHFGRAGLVVLVVAGFFLVNSMISFSGTALAEGVHIFVP